ncbi:MAG: hypothetical protein KGS47_16270, partial [Chloroflexi bacterium]|nr:hypothetical protein [Chloroflexota bacterium]
MTTPPPGDVSRVAAPFFARLQLADALRFAGRWLAPALLLCAAGALSLRLAGAAPLWAALPLVAWLVGALVVWRRRAPAVAAARRIDALLLLDDRLATAVECAAAAPPPFDVLLAGDAARALAAHQPRAIALLPTRGAWWRAVPAAALVLLALLVPDPFAAARATAERERAAIAELDAPLARLEAGLREDPTLDPATRAELAQQIAEVRQRLAEQPGDRAQALAELERATRALDAARDPQLAERRALLDRLARALDAPQAAQALREAAAADPAARQRLAETLAREAAALGAADPTGAALQQAADALRGDDPAAARDAL